MENDYAIAAGDWNFPLNRQLDVRNYTSINTQPDTRKTITDTIIKFDLVDICMRELYPDKHAYTCKFKYKTRSFRLFLNFS